MKISKKALVSTIAGACLGLVFNAIVGSLLPIIVGAALGLVLGMFMFPADGRKPKIEIVDSVDPVEGHLEKILALNKQLRLDPYLESEVLGKAETILDKLSGILPRVNREHTGSEVTYVINRMVTDYLPELFGPFLQLSDDARKGELESLMGTLNALDQEIDNIIKLVEDRKVNEFRVQDTFLRHKFGEKGVEA